MKALKTAVLNVNLFVTTWGTFEKGTEVQVIKESVGSYQVQVGPASFFVDKNKVDFI